MSLKFYIFGAFLWSLLIAIFVFAFLQIAACSHEEKPTEQKDLLAAELEKTKSYCSVMVDKTIEKRCDRATFAHLAGAFCPISPFDNSRHEWEPGEYHRDIKPKTCFPADSKSECSPDMFITKLHEWLSREDLEGLKRSMAYLESNDWLCGEGPSSLTSVFHLKPLFLSLKAHLEKSRSLTGFSWDLDELIKKHNQYLVALSIYLKMRLNGEINSLELAFLERFNDGGCIFEGLIARVKSGDQARALKSMSEFPSDAVPGGSSWRSWGSAPPSIMQAVCSGILNGK